MGAGNVQGDGGSQLQIDKAVAQSSQMAQGEDLPPRASAMIEAMRDIGYSLESAVADIIDNSITAQARRIDVRFGWHDDRPWIGIIDDGKGMSPELLREAMRPGTRNPLESRAKDDLGRFGLGLKTASFSQCRRLTVVTCREGSMSAARWDLDEVGRTDRWVLLRPSDEDVGSLPCISELGDVGTCVLWEAIDRIEFDGRDARGHQQLNEQMAVATEHIARVFHRFINGEPGHPKLVIRVNKAEVAAFDPFGERNPATLVMQEERVIMKTGDVLMQPYVLPHHTKVSTTEYQRLAGPEGYLRNQGFYVYRNRRLIIWGSWFRLASQEELTKLARIRIDIPNTQDHLWGIDVRKSRARPPAAVRERMKQIIERIRGSAKRPYTHRGAKVTAGGAVAVWQRRVFNDRVVYEINASHPLLTDLRADLEAGDRRRLDALLRMIAASFPAPAFFSDYATDPKALDSSDFDESVLVELARMIASANPDVDAALLARLLQGIEPFSSWPASLERVAHKALG